MSTSAGSYCYAPFGTEPNCEVFRIVKLAPGHGGEPIHCVLEHVAPGAPVEYEALSYVWGAPRRDATITCNGLPLNITRNLYETLRSLRLPDRERSLWVDAVCINQRDNDERSRQVRRMERIYPKARRVLVWLGDGRDDSGLAFETARDLDTACQRYVEEGGVLDNIAPADERASRVFGPFRRRAAFPGLEAFAKLLQRPWFGRVWVVQEVALATEVTVLCGRSSVDWDSLVAAVTAQDRLNLHLADHERSAFIFILQKARHEWRAGTRLGLLSVLFRFRIFDSTDPRDKIFGLSALNRGDLAETEVAQANYTISVRDLYCDIARTILKETLRLHLLSVPRRITGERIAGLPSWVPDWTNTRLTAPLGLANYSDIADLKFSASGSSAPDIQFEDDSSTLRVRGIAVDRITAVGLVLRVEKVPKTNYHGVRIPKCCFILEDWLKTASCRTSSDYKTGEESTLDAFVQTLVTGSAEQNTTAMREQLSILRRYAIIAKGASSLSRFLPGWMLDSVVQILHAVLFFRSTDQLALDFRINMSSLADRKIFRTATGYMGLGTALAEEGDVVVVVKGGRVPLVLRPEEDKRWTLRGDCYVRGIMDGELYSDEACEDLRIV
ncbi:HET-domain-containing protein [Xylariomycetidae sp. FL2044]|nr:HET-domain-containing protein [Xylariomycetidae sp. FL2044]